MLDIYRRPVYVDTFYVWRRSDGYVGVSNGHMPKDYVSVNGREWKYVLLLKTTDWPEAHDLIATERGRSDLIVPVYGYLPVWSTEYQQAVKGMGDNEE